ncbi:MULTISPECIES: endonuclease MutS2 [Petrotoga]|uniref:endonuclease MutS2 n=1 Tax=Petrotoga TaxID=28236 RepID=UPI000CDEEFD9|nr:MULTISPECIES: endonuclease MutS2 [Petrotoga]
MLEKTYKDLEIEKILNFVASYSHTDYGKEYFSENVKMYEDLTELDREVNISRVFFDMAIKGKLKDLYGLSYIPSIMEKISNKESIEGKEFRKIGEFLEDGYAIHKYYSGINDLLTDKLSDYKPLLDLKDQIFKVFTSEGEIKDNASIELKRIRNGINTVKHQLNVEFNKIKSKYIKYLSLDQPLERNGRLCIALKSENRNVIKGITVGRSDSGATLFVEPDTIIELNENLMDLFSQEKNEISRIISNLTFELQKNKFKIEKNIELIEYIDANIAKARYAKDMNAVFTLPQTTKKILLKELKHPLIPKEKIVPIDVELDRNGMIITGPNTGGKTVSLKSIGLAFFMAHSALPVLALNAEIPFIEEIYTDIGDQQDISQNLSTFSAHLLNLKNILENVDEKSLVLIDELGTGTDPIEGAALSKAILKYLLMKGPIIFATSHLSEIKTFSLEEEKLLAASMSFDIETLKPTYKLMIGVPGASHAIEIAERLGIDPQIIEESKRNLSEEFSQSEKVLSRLASIHKEYEESIERIRNKEEEIGKMKKEYEEKLQKLKNKEIESLDPELYQLKEQIKKMRSQIQNVLKEIKQYKDQIDLQEISKKLKESENMASQLEKIKKTLSQKQKGRKIERSKIKVGMKVKTSNNIKGTVKRVTNSKITVQIDGSPIEITYNPTEIEPIINSDKDKNEEKRIQVKIDQKKNMNTELDVRGYSVNEAIPEIEKFISDLISSGIKEGRIIHGKGTGKLAIGIWDYLRKSSLIKDFKIARSEEGGTGATVIEV